MPITPPVAAAGIGALSNLVGAGANANLNHKNRMFSLQMYGRQRQDQLDFWRMQNQYNDPKQQMARLKNAGLSPHLLYGQNSSGASGNAGSFSAPGATNPSTTGYSDTIGRMGNDAINAYYAGRANRAQVDAMDAQRQLNLAKTLAELARVPGIEGDSAMKSEMAKYSKDFASMTINKAMEEVNLTANRAIAEGQKIQVTANTIDDQIRQAKLDTKIKASLLEKTQSETARTRMATKFQALEYKLLRSGISMRDPIWQRLTARFFIEFINGDVDQFLNSLK